MARVYREAIRNFYKELEFWQRGRRQRLVEGHADYALGIAEGLKIGIKILIAQEKQHKEIEVKR